MKRDFKGIWITKEVWLSKDLTVMEKLFFIEIDSLDNEDGCFASNKYFADFFGITKGRCTQIIKALESKGFLTIKLIYEDKVIVKRIIKVVNKLNTPIKNIKQGYLENAQDNNTTINIYNNIGERLKSNDILIDTLKVKYGSKTDVLAKVDEFAKYSQSIKQPYVSESALFKHFTFWLPSNLKVIKNSDKEFDYFMKMFNEISNRKFEPTEEIRRLFAIQLQNGFTSSQMAKAIQNMRSSNDKNDWHKKTNYQFATPIHLLKDDNLNKYLNVKY